MTPNMATAAAFDERDGRGGAKGQPRQGESITAEIGCAIPHYCGVPSKKATTAAFDERDGRDGVLRFETSHKGIVPHLHIPDNRCVAGAGGDRTRGVAGLESDTSTPSNRPSMTHFTRVVVFGKAAR